LSGGRLRIKARKTQAGGRDADTNGVEVIIEDTGPGIPLDLREQIFNPFVTTKKTGVGLGLSIVSKIIDGHHGHISIEDAGNPAAGNGAPGSGARFVIFFPAAGERAAMGETSHLVIS